MLERMISIGRMLRPAFLFLVVTLAGIALVSLPLIGTAEAAGQAGNHGGGQGGGHSGGQGQGQAHQSANAGFGAANYDEKTPKIKNTLDSLGIAPSDLGKLNGFFHAAPTALDNASPDSAIGMISQTFREALLGYSSTDITTDPTVETAETEEPATIEDLAKILADASNKPMTAETVDAILNHLSDVYGDDYSSLTGESTDTTGETTTGDTTATDGTATESFAEELARLVNEINGFITEESADGGDITDEATVIQ